DRGDKAAILRHPKDMQLLDGAQDTAVSGSLPEHHTTAGIEVDEFLVGEADPGGRNPCSPNVPGRDPDVVELGGRMHCSCLGHEGIERHALGARRHGEQVAIDHWLELRPEHY